MLFRCLLLSVLAGVAVASVAVRSPAQVAEPTMEPARPAEEHVIPAGVEPLFADMLGNEQQLPGGCTFAGGQIERTVARATYRCPGGEVVLELLHPSAAKPGSVQTQRFALAVASGTPPQELVAAITTRVRAREGEFEWKTIGEQRAQGSQRLLPIVAGLAAAVLAAWVLRRFSSKRRSPGA